MISRTACLSFLLSVQKREAGAASSNANMPCALSPLSFPPSIANCIAIAPLPCMLIGVNNERSKELRWRNDSAKTSAGASPIELINWTMEE